MLYDYGCDECGFKDEYVHSMKDAPTILCPKCEARMERLFLPNTTGFIFKGGTEAINWKEKRHHLKKSAELGVRQIERYGSSGPNLKPNVAGLETESWGDAAKFAKEAGMNADSYKPMIEKEKTVSKTSGVDDTKWKKAKEKAF